MKAIVLSAVLMVGMTSFAQKGMNDYTSVSLKPDGNVKVFVETFRTYVFNIDFIEDGSIYDTEIEKLMSEYYRILTANDIKFRTYSMKELFDMINRNNFIFFHYIKDGIEYTVTIQDTSGEIIVITEQ